MAFYFTDFETILYKFHGFLEASVLLRADSVLKQEALSC